MRFRRRILDISQTVGALHAAPAFSCLEAVDVIYYGLIRKELQNTDAIRSTLHSRPIATLIWWSRDWKMRAAI